MSQLSAIVAAELAHAPTVTGFPQRAPDLNGWYRGPVQIDWLISDDGGQATHPPDTLAQTEGANITYISDPACDPANHCATGQLALSIDLTDPTVTCQVGSFNLNQPGAIVSATVTDETSGPAVTTVSALANTSVVGSQSVSLTGFDNAGRTRTVACPYSVGYVISGFLQPIDNSPTVNQANAGQTIPVKWRITDHDGSGISDRASFVSITSGSTTCSSSDPLDAVETYSGNSGLQYLGDGYWQFNWKTPKSFRGRCRLMRLDLADGRMDRIAHFQFR